MALAESLLVSLAIAASAVYFATPYVIAVADRLQFYDAPIGYKSHARPTPYLGGAAVMAGFALALLLATSNWGRTLPLVGGVALLWAVGTVDDRRTVPPGLRVAVELLVGVMVWASGLGWHLHMGPGPDLALTCVWIVAVVNAFNLFDNMDGAASTMALVASAGVLTLGAIRNDTWLAIAAAALGGACLGFLPRNLARPARIFLGDGGSMPLGFAVAVLAMPAAAAAPVPWQSVIVGLLLVGIPALDSCLVVVSRRRRGVSVLTGGRDHLTHRVRRFLPGSRAVAVSLGGVQAGACGLAVLASQGGATFAVFSATLYAAVAACAICVLDSRSPEEFAAADGARLSVPKPVKRDRAAPAALALFGLGAALSPFVSAYYSPTTWVPIGLCMVVAATVAMVARPNRIRGASAVAVGGLVGLGMWSLSSAAWAQSVEDAVVDGNLLLVYGAAFVLLLTLLRTQRRSAWLLLVMRAGVVAVGVSVLVRLLGSDPGSMFLAGRLNAPLGYINGEGCLFVMGFWLCWGAAERARPLNAGLGAAAATLLACLALLSESRGTALAMAVSLLVVVAAVPGRRIRLCGLFLVAVGVALARTSLLAVYQEGVGGSLPATAAHATILVAVAVGVSWAGATAVRVRLIDVDAAFAARLRRAGSVSLVALGLACVVALVASAPRIQRDVSSQWYAFTHLAEPADAGISSGAGQSRLLSGAGNRYDYWRIALNVWSSNPIVGAGAGNYDQPYFLHRATTEDIRQPHSLELQTLAELGLIGAALLLTFLVGIAGGVRRMRFRARDCTREAGVMIGALGSATAWLTQTSVDWMHLLPGLTAIALGAMAVLSGERNVPTGATVVPKRRRSRRAPAAALGLAGIAVALVMAGASLSRQGLADLFRGRAQAEVASRPAAALAAANRSLSLDADAVASYYVKAAALARFNEASAAEGVLRVALRREPQNFVTWTLLGDIAVREGRLDVAKANYGRAHALNPRDSTLRALAVDPRAGLQ